ncbi:MAG: glycoside hydrolase family 16 protein, partial [Bacteroidota bacterium]
MRASLVLTLCALSIALAGQCPTLVWSDEFEGNSLNTNDWNYQAGDGCDLGICGWGNNEQQWYQQDNISVVDGILRITARQESVGGKPYTSGRITTRNKQEFRYGYLEARIKVPPGRGLWPAFWMLPTDEVYGFWPQSGEIDIMEWVGRDPETLFGTLHFGQPSPNNSSTGVELDLTDAAWSDNFHTYAVAWEEGAITWYVDGYRYGSRTPASLDGENWPFDQDFHFLLNLAVGGNFGGAVSNAAFPATMEVDYVRVYNSRPLGLRGPREADAGSTAAFVIENLPSDAGVTYEIPEGAVVTPDPDNPAVFRVTFGNNTGVVSATVSGSCGTTTVGTQVRVIPKLSRAFSFENFDDQERINFAFATGNLSEVDNPAPDALNA